MKRFYIFFFILWMTIIWTKDDSFYEGGNFQGKIAAESKIAITLKIDGTAEYVTIKKNEIKKIKRDNGKKKK